MNSKKTYDMLFNILKYFISGLLIICFLVYLYLYFKFEGTRSERQSKAFGGVVMFLYFFPAIIVSFIRLLYDSVKNLFH